MPTSFSTPFPHQSHVVEQLGDEALPPRRNIAINEFRDEQVVLILVGLVGSGKSTFAEGLASSYPQFTRCSQDDLGNRPRVEEMARQTLRQGRSVCIDRTNFNASQRAYWIDIAREAGVPVWVIVFDTPYEVCAARLQHRTMHPTIKNPAQGLLVLDRFASDFQKPTINEGHDRLIYLKQSDQSLLYTHYEITSILQRLRDALPPSANHYSPQRGPQYTPRGGRSYAGFSPSNSNEARSSGRSSSRLSGSLRGRGWRSGIHHSAPSGTVVPIRSHDLRDNNSIYRGSSDTLVRQSRPSDSRVGGSQGSSHWRGCGSAHDPFTIS